MRKKFAPLHSANEKAKVTQEHCKVGNKANKN
jgi:hypothetical protein